MELYKTETETMCEDRKSAVGRGLKRWRIEGR